MFPAEYTEVTTYWRGVVGTLAQRGLLRHRQDGQKIIPHATAAIVEPERVCFVLDMLRLGGISREDWLDESLWLQIKSALQGRRCFVADSAGLAVVVGRIPMTTEMKRLPPAITLDVEMLPAGDYTAYLGEAKDGAVVLDISAAERAILVGGTTGSGKTGTMRSIVLQLANKNTPKQFSLIIVDLKRLDFQALQSLPHLVKPVATTEDDAQELVGWVEQEMERRQGIMQGAGVTKWDDLPIESRFPLLLLLIDEVADFAHSHVMDSLTEIARKGRASGISLIVGTQRPDADVLSRQVKANITTRIAFQTVDNVESRIILDRSGAERLNRVGLCLTNANRRLQKVQAAYVPDDNISDWVEVQAQPALTPIEQELVEYALSALDGAFSVNPLYDEFKGRISKYALTQLAQRWQLRGWLTSPTHNGDGHKLGRQVTPELEALLPQNGDEDEV